MTVYIVSGICIAAGASVLAIVALRKGGDRQVSETASTRNADLQKIEEIRKERS